MSRISSSQSDLGLGLPSRRKTAVIDASSCIGKSRIPAPSAAIGGSRQSFINKSGRNSTIGRNSTVGIPKSRVSGVLTNRVSLQSSKRSSRSSVYGHSGTGIKKDPRPLSDKGYQQASIKKLRSFLIEEQYPRDIKPKCFQSLSTKEFIFILNFILERLDPMLVISGLRIDEELPFVIKLLKYPFVVSKNHMVSVGSPHSWPILLGLLMWLLNGIQTDMTKQLLFPKQNDFDESDFEENSVELSNELYRMFLLKGPDSVEYNELLQTKEAVQRNLYEQSEEALQSEVEVNQILIEELEELQKSSIESLKHELQQLHTSCENQVHYLNTELGPSIDSVSIETIGTQKHSAALESQTEAAKENIAQLLEQIKTQPMSAREATDLRQRIKEKQDIRLTLKKRVEEARNGVFDLQRRHGNIIVQVDKECKEVNDVLRKLSAVIPDGQYIPILDYNTTKRADPVVLQQLTKQAKNIKASIHQLNERTAQELASIDSEIINAESAFSMLQTELLTKQIEVENGEHDVAREKKTLEHLKRKRGDDMKLFLSSKMSLEDELLSYQSILQCDDVQQLWETANERYEKEYQRVVSSVAQNTESLQELCLMISGLLEKQHTKQHCVHQDYQKLLNIFQEIKPPAVHSKFYTSK